MNSEVKLSDCIENDPRAQRMLYQKYSQSMYKICLRFARNKMDADDILQEGFIKIFAKLKDFRNEGAFEGWIRRIMINTSINFYKRKYPYFKAVDFESSSGSEIAARLWEYPEGSGLETYQDSTREPGWRKLVYPGEYSLVYRATDLLGAVGRDTVTVTVQDTVPPAPPPVVTITSPAADLTLVQ